MTHGKPIKLHDLQKMKLKVRNILTDFPDIADDIWEFYCRYELVFQEKSAIAKIIMSKNGLIVRTTPQLQFQFTPPMIPQPPTPK